MFHTIWFRAGLLTIVVAGWFNIAQALELNGEPVQGGMTDLGVIGGDDEVSHHGVFAATGQAVAMHLGNDDFGEIENKHLAARAFLQAFTRSGQTGGDAFVT